MHPIIHAASRPDHPAIVMAGSGERVSYGAMDRYANRCARLLRARGLAPGDAVAVLLENGPDYLQIVWGSQRAGTTLVPVATHLSAAAIAWLLGDCEARLLVTSARFAALLPALRQACPALTVLVIAGAGAGAAEDGEDLRAALAACPDAPLSDAVAGQYMLYSSGTTGRPKGIRPAPLGDGDVLAPHPLVKLAVAGFGMPADGSMVYLSPAPLYHAAPLGWCGAVHRLGGTVVVMEQFDPAAALAAMARHRVTDSQWVPTHFVRMLKLPPAERARHDLSRHRRAIHAAAPCPVPVKRAMIDWWGPILTEYYAGSEAVGMTMIAAADWLAHPGSVGRAIHGRIHVCDPAGRELAPGEEGLVYFESDTVPSYHNDPAQTARALHPRGWMTLGDIGRLDAEGYLTLTDRESALIISGGVNIYPQEIESLLVTHPRVMDAAVVGEACPDLGEAVVAVVQPVAPEDAGDALAQELRAFLAARLGTLKLPRRFVFAQRLPREANGKLYKRALGAALAPR